MTRKLIDIELMRHWHMVQAIKEVLYSNPLHIRGVMQYRDKKRLNEIENKVEKDRVTLSYKDFQFLQSIVEKYG